MTDDDAGGNRIEALALTLIFCAISVALLALLGVATRTGSASAGWWTRPALAPGAALAILVAANLITLAKQAAEFRARPVTGAEWRDARVAILGWLRPLEYLGYYAAYVWAIQHAGYGPATLVFVLGLSWRAGLTGGRWVLAGLGLVAFMMLVFRAGLGVWMPAPELYELLPDAARSAAIRWF